MKTFKIKKDDKDIQPTQEQIERNKDFKRLYANYDKMVKRPKPMYKDKKFFFLLILILIIAYLVATES